VADTSTSTQLLAELRGRRSDREAELNERRREVGLEPVSLEPPEARRPEPPREPTTERERADYAHLASRVFSHDPRQRLSPEQAKAVMAFLGPRATVDLAASPGLWLQILNLTRTWVGNAEDALESDDGPDVDQARQSLAMTTQLLAALQEWSAAEVAGQVRSATPVDPLQAVEDPDQSATPPREPDR
jgi:hypothetical protein